MLINYLSNYLIFIIGSCCVVFDRGVGWVVEDYSSICIECLFKY